MSGISARDRKYFQLALLVARDSECNYKHGAVIVRASNILSVAANRAGSSKKQVKHKQHVITVHAETRAIIKSCIDLEDSILYSARCSKQIVGATISKPCSVCWENMIDAKIHTVVYYDGFRLVKERV
jgi:deoxycytidylate deaminase